MRKILLISQNFTPEYSGIAKYTSSLVSDWVLRGDKVYLITMHPHYPVYKFKFKYLLYSINSHCNLTVIRCPTFLFGDGILGKLINQILFSIFLLPAFFLIVSRIKLIFIMIPSGLSAITVMLFNSFFRKKIWVHVQDNDLSIFFKMLFNTDSNLLDFYYRRFLSSSDCISTVSNDLTKKFDHGLTLPNWLDVDFQIWDSSNNFNACKLSPDRFKVLFSGTLNKKSNLADILLAAKNYTSVDFIVCGSGPESSIFVEPHPPNLFRLDFLELDQYYALLKAVDCHLITQLPNINCDVFPSKLMEIFLSGKPLVAQTSISGDFHDIVQIYGKCSYGYNYNAIIDSIKFVKSDYTSYLLKAKKSKEYVTSHLSKDVLLEKFYEQIRFLYQTK